MLRVAYIADTEPAVKPKRMTRKQKIKEAARVTLANRRFQDRLAAQEMFPELRKELEEKKIRLESILKSKTKYHV